ncbi:MAG TPA: hypothetical protein H9668_04510 [Firmicutes bacterium]|nr:hypothetical protein [Bacillota bacterium]
MNAQKFTQKSLEAVEAAQTIATEHDNMNLDEEHLLLALLEQDGGLIPQLVKRMGLDADRMQDSARRLVESLPGVSGPGREAGKIYVSPALDKMLAAAEKTADSMKDEYVSVEHLFLSMLDHPNEAVKKLFGEMGVEKNAFLKALSEVRGATRVTSDSPESTYDALKKYGTDLVERARAKKLDPVIGRDD